MKYDIGDFVVVTKFSFKNKKENNKRIVWDDISYSKPKLGRVVGLVRKWDGVRHYSGYMGDFCSNLCYFEPTKGNVFYGVRFGWFNKPVCVRAENMRLANLDEIQDIPKLYTRQPEWTKQSRSWLSKESKNFPRDEKGRFSKMK